MPDPVDTETPSPAPGVESCGAALHRHARAELDIAIDWLSVDGAGKRRLHKGVHQGRKALRRTRATLALVQPALGHGADMVDRELRRVVRGLGDMRDGQALVETLTRLLAGCDDATVAAHLQRARRAAVRRRHTLAEATLADDPGLAGRRAVLTALAGALDALPWAGVTLDTVHAALQASATATDKARERAAAHGRDRDWHRWRRRIRRQSQQHTALAASGIDFGKSSLGKDAFDKRTATLLGIAQDLSLLLDHCGHQGGFGKADRLALAAYAEAELVHLRQQLRDHA